MIIASSCHGLPALSLTVHVVSVLNKHVCSINSTGPLFFGSSALFFFKQKEEQNVKWYWCFSITDNCQSDWVLKITDTPLPLTLPSFGLSNYWMSQEMYIVSEVTKFHEEYSRPSMVESHPPSFFIFLYEVSKSGVVLGQGFIYTELFRKLVLNEGWGTNHISSLRLSWRFLFSCCTLTFASFPNQLCVEGY